MKKVEDLLMRGLHRRAMAKDPDRVVQQVSLEIVNASPNIHVPIPFACELLGCCEAWLRRHVTEKRRSSVPLSLIRDFMARVKAYSLGGDPDAYRHDHDLELVKDQVRAAYAAARVEEVDADIIFAAYAPRILRTCGDRFLSRDQVLIELGRPIPNFGRGKGLFTPLDLRMGQNQRRPFRRYSFLEVIEKRASLEE